MSILDLPIGEQIVNLEGKVISIHSDISEIKKELKDFKTSQLAKNDQILNRLDQLKDMMPVLGSKEWQDETKQT